MNKIACWMLGVLLLSHQEDKKLPIPDVPAQKEAEKVIREIFKDEYTKRAPADKSLLARKLFAQASRSKEDGASWFVLLREAKDLASAAGDLELALKAVDEIAKAFEGDVSSMRSAVLSASARTAKSPEEFQRLAKSYLALADEAAGRDQFDVAEKAAEQASIFAMKTKNMPLASRADVRSKELAELRAGFEIIAKAKEALKRDPDDPAANVLVGKHLSFAKGDWETGLRHLSKGNDEALKALAVKDLALPTAYLDQVALGDAWWELGDKQAGQTGKALVSRAATWYGKALPELSGLHRARIEKRLKEFAPAMLLKAAEVDLLSGIDPGIDSLKGTWQLVTGKLRAPAVAGGAFAACAVPYIPPQEYDLTLVAERRSGNSSILIGLIGGGRQFDLELDGGGGEFSGLDRIDGKWALANETRFRGGIFAVGVPHTVIVRMRTDKVIVVLDDKEVVSWVADYRRVSIHPCISVKSTESLFLGTWQSEYLIHQFTLKLITGEGRFQR